MKLMFILLCLSSIVIVNGQKSGFLATFPTSVIPGDTAKFCIRFFNVANDVVIKILDDKEPKLFETFHESVKSSKK
jgi:hypothetical protein